MALYLACVVHEEGLLAGTAFRADKASRKAGIEHDHVNVRGNERQGFLEFRVGKGFLSEKKGVLVRMSGIVENELGSACLAPALFYVFCETREGVVDFFAVGIGENHAVARFNAAHLVQGISKPPGVAQGVAKAFTSFSAVIGRDVEG